MKLTCNPLENFFFVIFSLVNLDLSLPLHIDLRDSLLIMKRYNKQKATVDCLFKIIYFIKTHKRNTKMICDSHHTHFKRKMKWKKTEALGKELQRYIIPRELQEIKANVTSTLNTSFGNKDIENDFHQSVN